MDQSDIKNQQLKAIEDLQSKLNQLCKSDIVEIKSFNNPPHDIKIVLEGIMILFGKDQSWQTIKKELADTSFIMKVKEFDKNNVLDEVAEQLDQHIQRNENAFDYQKCLSKSKAAACFASYCVNMNQYIKLQKQLQQQQPEKPTQDKQQQENNENQVEIKQSETELTPEQKKQDLVQKIKDKNEEIETLKKTLEQINNNIKNGYINKRDITVLLRFDNPPEIVYQVLYAMIIILNKYPEAYYRIINIIGYKLLWDIKDFDYSKPLPEEIGDKLIEHKKNYPNAYMSQRVAKASQQAGYLSKWVSSFANRYETQKELVQKEQILKSLNQQLTNLTEETK